MAEMIVQRRKINALILNNIFFNALKVCSALFILVAINREKKISLLKIELDKNYPMIKCNINKVTREKIYHENYYTSHSNFSADFPWPAVFFVDYCKIDL